MKHLIKKLRVKKSKKAQTALEYALVVGAITLVIMAAWNAIGKDVQTAMRGKLSQDIQKNLIDGNATQPK